MPEQPTKHTLYIHIPFCEKKCLYCSFAVAVGQRGRIDEYLNALEKEMDLYPCFRWASIYIGGGTPTVLSARQLRDLFERIRDHYDCSSVEEITIEANPEGLSPQKAEALMDLGVTRMSLGVQTFDDGRLKFLGRCHTRTQALESYHILRRAGHRNINIDLMFGFPDQTESGLRRDLKELTALTPDHVSLYSLTVEEYSRFYVSGVQPLSSHRQAGLYPVVCNSLQDAGFVQYEISNFSKPGFESRHNIHYWTGGEYLGLGAGAHSHMDHVRRWNTRKFPKYLRCMKAGGSALEGQERRDSRQQMTETLLFGLRMNKGVDLLALEERYAVGLSESQRSRIAGFVRDGFLQEEQGVLKATGKGRMALDDLSVYLV